MDIRGVYRFSSLVKQNKKAKIYAVFCFAGKRKLLFYIYAVIVKQKIYKRSSNYYWLDLVDDGTRWRGRRGSTLWVFLEQVRTSCGPQSL